jgi:hypothetical protein
MRAGFMYCCYCSGGGGNRVTLLCADCTVQYSTVHTVPFCASCPAVCLYACMFVYIYVCTYIHVHMLCNTCYIYIYIYIYIYSKTCLNRILY